MRLSHSSRLKKAPPNHLAGQDGARPIPASEVRLTPSLMRKTARASLCIWPKDIGLTWEKTVLRHSKECAVKRRATPDPPARWGSAPPDPAPGEGEGLQ